MGTKGKHNVAMRFKMDQKSPLRIWSGSENAKELKACYYMFGIHVNSTEKENIRDMKKVLNRIKLEVIDNVDKNIFKDQFIFVETTPVAFDNTTYAYVTGEFTFFIDGEHHKSIIENRMNRITPHILKHLQEHEKFTYTRERERV